MKILHVVGGLDPNAGGPSRSVAGLCKSLCEVGCSVALFVHDTKGLAQVDIGDCEVFKGHGFSAAKGVWRDDFIKAVNAWNPDLVHMHGIWSLFMHEDVKVCKARGIPYIIAPRGSLDAWSLRQKWLKKLLALWLYQRRDLYGAVAIHTTAESETKYARAQGCSQYIIQCPNGVNLPVALPPEERPQCGVLRALFLSRMSEKKGALDLVEAWGRVRPVNWVCEFVYTVGNERDRQYEARVKRRVSELSLDDVMIFTGAMSDEGKWKAYRRSNAFILPTYTENFGIVIAEALYAGVPVLTTKGSPWSGLIKNECGWWTDIGISAIAEGLRELAKTSREVLKEMGLRGHDYVAREFNWATIANQMKHEYASLLNEMQMKHIMRESKDDK